MFAQDPAAIVLLESFANSVSAHLAKNQLEIAEIPCFISNENRPHGPISGGVRLHVRQQDLAAAQELRARAGTMWATSTETDDEPEAAPTAPPPSLMRRLRTWLLE